MDADALPLLIGRRVAGRRAQLDLSLEEIATRTGVSRAMISRIERGEVHASAVVLDKLCAGLGISLSALFARDAASPLLRRADQPVWQDPASGYLRREIAPAGTFYRAEDDHQDYFARNPYQPYCQFVVAPKVAKFRKQFLELGSPRRLLDVSGKQSLSRAGCRRSQGPKQDDGRTRSRYGCRPRGAVWPDKRRVPRQPRPVPQGVESVARSSEIFPAQTRRSHDENSGRTKLGRRAGPRLLQGGLDLRRTQ